MLQSLYNCRMSELYTIARIAWAACSVELPTFSGFSAAYDSSLIASRIGEIDAAELLPDYQARNAVAQNLRTDLLAVNERVLLLYMRLERYITYAYPAAQHQAQYDAAGKMYYQEAQNLNWDSSAAMLVSMTNFIAANDIQLQANSNMPSTFGASVVATQASFIQVHQDFLAAENAAFVATETKVAANNLLYQNMLAMFKDARYLGFSDAQMKSFTFSSLLQLVTSGPPSKLKGVVTDAATSLPIVGATVELTNLGISALSDSLGRYLFNSVPNGVYNVLVQASGFQDYTTVVTIVPTSVAASNILDIQMTI